MPKVTEDDRFVPRLLLAFAIIWIVFFLLIGAGQAISNKFFSTTYTMPVLFGIIFGLAVFYITYVLGFWPHYIFTPPLTTDERLEKEEVKATMKIKPTGVIHLEGQGLFTQKVGAPFYMCYSLIAEISDPVKFRESGLRNGLEHDDSNARKGFLLSVHQAALGVIGRHYHFEIPSDGGKPHFFEIENWQEYRPDKNDPKLKPVSFATISQGIKEESRIYTENYGVSVSAFLCNQVTRHLSPLGEELPESEPVLLSPVPIENTPSSHDLLTPSPSVVQNALTELSEIVQSDNYGALSRWIEKHSWTKRYTFLRDQLGTVLDIAHKLDSISTLDLEGRVRRQQLRADLHEAQLRTLKATTEIKNLLYPPKPVPPQEPPKKLPFHEEMMQQAVELYRQKQGEDKVRRFFAEQPLTKELSAEQVEDLVGDVRHRAKLRTEGRHP